MTDPFSDYSDLLGAFQAENDSDDSVTSAENNASAQDARLGHPYRTNLGPISSDFDDSIPIAPDFDTISPNTGGCTGDGRRLTSFTSNRPNWTNAQFYETELVEQIRSQATLDESYNAGGNNTNLQPHRVGNPNGEAALPFNPEDSTSVAEDENQEQTIDTYPQQTSTRQFSPAFSNSIPIAPGFPTMDTNDLLPGAPRNTPDTLTNRPENGADLEGLLWPLNVRLRQHFLLRAAQSRTLVSRLCDKPRRNQKP